MKSLRLLVCALPLAVTGCSTLSSVNWSAANPWNWFGSSVEVTEQGVGGITSTTALDEQAINDALGGDYRLRSGMKTDNGTIVRYFEALSGDKLALVVNGENGTVSRIDVLDSAIKTDSGVEIGATFSDIYNKAYGHCQKATGDDSAGVECKAEGSQHISYLFTGEWSGPQDLMPSDDALKNWTLKKIVWHR
ncbi:RpoE-regulated lipoprotein [Pseudocitrobacter cyperus]|uniref:RpoE-regulated lipoprotein n=1 Tax=Pseudocitrobacter cyperus TaxID=3112843 RepID=A0ABV0HNC6_9ENTR